MQAYNFRIESPIQEFLILNLKISRIFFNLFYLPNDSGSFIIQFHGFLLGFPEFHGFPQSSP